ncbi:MAG TPA: DUF6544 family protein [Chroococcidiopsis sp.]
MVTKHGSLDALWQSAPSTDQVFEHALLEHLPKPAQRYLKYAIAPYTPLASTARLRMHGEIKLKNWLPFQAEQVICWNHGMVWQATTWMRGLPVFGADRLVDGAGSMEWKLLGLFPVMKASGDDVTRSGIGRMLGECVWLPSVLCNPKVTTWSAPDDNHAHATLGLGHETTELMITISETGRPEQVCFRRWGNPDGEAHHYATFGCYLEREGKFAGYTVPTQIRAGWHFGTDRFESQGEFFRATVDAVTYR